MFVMELNPYSARTNGQEIVGIFYQILANYAEFGESLV